MHCTDALPVFLISSESVIVQEDPDRYSPIYVTFLAFLFTINIPDTPTRYFVLPGHDASGSTSLVKGKADGTIGTGEEERNSTKFQHISTR